MWFLSLSFVQRNVRQTNTDGDKHTGMVRGWRLCWHTSRMPINTVCAHFSDVVREVSVGLKLFSLVDQTDIH